MMDLGIPIDLGGGSMKGEGKCLRGKNLIPQLGGKTCCCHNNKKHADQKAEKKKTTEQQNTKLGGDFKYVLICFILTPKLGEDSHFD